MAITEYGKVVRDFRDKVGVSLREMARRIGLSPTYISAIEMGEKTVTEDIVHKVVGVLRKAGIPNKDFAKLWAAADRTRRSVDVSALDSAGKLAVAGLARKWDDLDRSAREKFLRLVDAKIGSDDK